MTDDIERKMQDALAKAEVAHARKRAAEIDCQIAKLQKMKEEILREAGIEIIRKAKS